MEKQKKCRGKLSVTTEMMKHILGLPKEVEVLGAHTDQREVIHFTFRSDKPTSATVETNEGCEFMQVEKAHVWMWKRVIRLMEDAQEAEAQGWVMDEGYLQAKKELEEEKKGGNQ